MCSKSQTSTLRSNYRALLILIAASLPPAGYAQEQPITGELSQRSGYSVEEETISVLETEVLLSIDTDLADRGHLKVETIGTYDYVDDRGSLTLGEAYTSFYTPSVDLFVGNQIINWGTADGFNPSSPVNPIVPESLVDEEIHWEPVPAVSATYYLGSVVDLTAVVVLDVLPIDVSSIAPDLTGAADVEGIEDPPSGESSAFEYGGKIGTYVAGWDLKATYFYGFEDLPALAAKTQLDAGTGVPIAGSTTVVGSYRKSHRLALAAAGQLFSLGAWGEAAYVLPESKEFADRDPLTVTTVFSSDEPRFETITGVDYTFPGGLYAQLQYLYLGSGGLANPYSEEPGRSPDSSHLLLPRLTYTAGLDNSVELAALVDVVYGAGLLLPSVTLGIGPATDFRVAAHVPVGDPPGLSGRFDHALTAALSTAF